jgi:hypothetical protein
MLMAFIPPGAALPNNKKPQVCTYGGSDIG